MIKTRVNLQGIDETVLRPIIISVTKDIQKLLGINREIYTLHDPAIKIAKKKDALGNITGNNTVNEEYITSYYKENSVAETSIMRLNYTPDTKPFYIDRDIYTNFTAIPQDKKVTITFTIYDKSKSKISSYINFLKLMISSEGMYRRHELEYHYGLPISVVELLMHFNDLKNLRESTPIDIDTYVKNTFDNRADFINSNDGVYGKTVIGIREAQLEVQGYITTSIADIEPEFEESNSSYFLTFEYEFTYSKPISILLTYPRVIYNTLIDKKFRIFLEAPMPRDRANRTYASDSLVSMFGLNKLKLDLNNSKYYLTIPSWDNDELPSPPSYTARMFSYLLLIDPNELNSLINIKELPGIEFKSPVLDFIINSERDFIGILHGSLFYIELFKDFKKDFNNKVILDADGNLTTLYPMDIKSTYRVMFSIVTDVNVLTPDAKRRLREFINSEVGAALKSEYRTDLFIDSILTLFNVSDGELANAVSNINNMGDLLFSIEERSWKKIKTTEIVLTLTGVINEK